MKRFFKRWVAALALATGLGLLFWLATTAPLAAAIVLVLTATVVAAVPGNPGGGF